METNEYYDLLVCPPDHRVDWLSAFCHWRLSDVEGGDTVQNILVIGNVLVISLGMESDSFNQQIESPRRISTGNLNIMIVSYVYIYGLYLQCLPSAWMV